MADGNPGAPRLDVLLDRFTTEARDAVSLAHAEARRLGHTHIGTEHLLLGILSEGSTAAAQALSDAGATLAGCRDKADELVGPPPAGSGPGGEVQLSPRAARALERAGRLAIRQRSEQVEAEHLLIAVVEVEGRAGQVLRGVSVDPATLARSLRNGDDAPSTAPEAEVAKSTAPEATGPVTPRCAACGVELAAAIAHRVLLSRGESDEARKFLVTYCSSCGATIGAERAR